VAGARRSHADCGTDEDLPAQAPHRTLNAAGGAANGGGEKDVTRIAAQCGSSKGTADRADPGADQDASAQKNEWAKTQFPDQAGLGGGELGLVRAGDLGRRADQVPDPDIVELALPVLPGRPAPADVDRDGIPRARAATTVWPAWTPSR